jgi:hypothetical protein
MFLTEDLLVQWTGLKGRDLSIFYLTYKQQASTALLYSDLDILKKDILRFKEKIYNKNNVSQLTEGKVKSMVNYWESKIKR